MITIGVADNNQTYCQGLKTMLEQVEGFRVVLLSPGDFCPEVPENLPIDILLVDEDLLETSQTAPGKKAVGWPAEKTIVMKMDCHEMSSPATGVEAICKGAGKREFAEKIMKINRVGPVRRII